MPETKPLPPDTSQQEDICSWSAVWYSVRSRLAEWKRGGGPFSVALVGLDGKEQLRQCHGEAAYETVLPPSAGRSSRQSGKWTSWLCGKTTASPSCVHA